MIISRYSWIMSRENDKRNDGAKCKDGWLLPTHCARDEGICLKLISGGRIIVGGSSE